ncbi:unnamed protein product, partial [Brassica rapa]
TSVAFHQYTYQHVGPWTKHADPSRGLFGTLVLGLSTLTLPVDCSGDFGPRGLSVQYTQDVRGCPPARTDVRRPWLSVCIRVCPSAHTGRPWLSISTHISTTSVAVHQYTYQHVGPWTQHAGPSHGLFGTHRTFMAVHQHTHDVCGCPTHMTSWLSVSTHRTSVAVHVCPCVTHRTSVAVRQHTQDVSGCPCVFVAVRQYTQDVRGSHTGRPCVSVSTHRTSVAVRVTSVAIRVSPCVSISVRQPTQDVCGCPSVHISARWPVDCLGDFGPRGLSVHYTQDVRGCPPAHTGRRTWLSVCFRVFPCVSVGTHGTSVSVHQYTYQHAGPWTRHAGPSRGLFGAHRTSVCVRQHTQDVRGCLWLSVSTHRTSVAVHFGCPCVFVAVRQYTQDVRRPWLSISTHISTLVLGLSTLTLPVDCLGNFGPPHTGRSLVSVSTHRTSVCVRQYTQDVRGCPCVSYSTHRMSVAVHQYTYQHVGPWTQHADPSLWVILAHVGCLFITHRTSVAVRQHTQDDVHGCPSAHTGCLWLSVCVCVCP